MIAKDLAGQADAGQAAGASMAELFKVLAVTSPGLGMPPALATDKAAA